jgi:hypothetical protein
MTMASPLITCRTPEILFAARLIMEKMQGRFSPQSNPIQLHLSTDAHHVVGTRFGVISRPARGEQKETGAKSVGADAFFYFRQPRTQDLIAHFVIVRSEYG